MDTDKELSEMMAAIKNLKDKEQTMNINSNDNTETHKDTSFYSRIFHHDKPKEEKADPVATGNSIQKQLDEYFESVAFNKKLEELVQQCIMNSVQNQIYMKKLIQELVKEYTNYNTDLEKTTNDLLKDEIMKIIKNCSTNIAHTLTNI